MSARVIRLDQRPSDAIWWPTPKQAEYLASTEDEVLYGGAAGGGKTDALTIDALGLQQSAVANPDYRALLLRRTYPELKEVIDRSRTIYPQVSPGAVYHESEHEWRFPSGARIELGYLERDSDVLRYQSRQFQFLGWEELTQWPTDYPYRYMLSRLRTTERSSLRCYCRATSNPGGPGERWVREYWQIQPNGMDTCFAVPAGDRTFGRRFIRATLRDNPHIHADYADRLKLLPEADRKALLDGLWGVINVPGAIFKAEMDAAHSDGRITSVPYQRELMVHTYWDIGIGDSTAIWCVQFVGAEVHLIDYHEEAGKDIAYYVGWLNQRGYAYGTDWLPHDAQARELGTGKSIEELLRGMDRLVRITPMLKIESGIQAARMLMHRCWFDAKRCERGIETLSNYRRDYNNRIGEFFSPLHDWASHGADAFRYLAVAEHQSSVVRVLKPIKYDTRGIV